MTGLLLISTSLIALLGATLLVLARLEPQHRHIGEWGWSHICLAAGVALAPACARSLHYRAGRRGHGRHHRVARAAAGRRRPLGAPPLARSVFTHVFGTYVQGILATALILLPVRRAHRETERATEALRRQALHDELTDLPNRHAALDRLAELTRPGSPGFVLLSADLDRFQLVN